MIDQVDRRLRDWVKGVVEGVDVRLEAPRAAETGRGIGLYLMEMASLPPPSTHQLPPWQVGLRYLVTTWSPESEEAHRILGELVFAALQNPEFQVELEPVPADVWQAFGIAPRPSFVLRVPLQQARARPKVKLVRAAPVVQTAAMVALQGVVRGPGDIPIAGADVEIPALHLSTRTDSRGRFFFAAVPGGGRPQALRVKAKGQEANMTTAETGKPVLVRLEIEED
ncbi:MAG TPA: Pvc16 family protein [Candidatus Sulfotelmatobacter sp.]|nr:Pvc16 family protein [Candidatus Sulfotelmatobacter sp.]